MKKIIRILGFTAVVLVFFVNTNSLTKSGSSITLADLVSINNANAEWWDDWCSWCDDDLPYGDEQVPYSDLCGAGYTYVFDPNVNQYVKVPVGGTIGWGIECVPAQTMGPLFCEWQPAC